MDSLASLLVLLGLWGEIGEIRVGLAGPVDVPILCAEWTPIHEGPRPAPTCATPRREGVALYAPVGRWDVRLVADGYAPVYYWDLDIGPDRPVDIGSVRLVPGASVSGWIAGIDLETETGPPIELVLRRKVYGWLGDPDQRRRADRLDIAASPNSEGFFQLVGVDGGRHELLARVDDQTTQRLTEIDLRAGEAVSFDAPFAVEPPEPITVYVDPPVDGLGAPWTIEVKRHVPKTHVLESIDRGPTDSGAWASRRLAPGRYGVEVTDASGSEWASRTIDVGVTRFVEIALELRRMRGTLLLGGEPLAAEIVFGTMNRRPRIVIQSDEDGRFEGALPKAGRWPIEIALDGDLLAAESVTIDPDDDLAEIAIELPGTWLNGRVTRRGQPVDGAIVVVRRTSDRQQVATARSDADGSFRWRGLPEGEVAVSALVGHDTSSWVFASLVDGGEPPDIELQIGARRSVRGRLLRSGLPVVGAEINYRVGDPSFMPHSARAISDLDGRFDLAVLAEDRSIDVLVVAPGVGTHIARFDLPGSEHENAETVELPPWILPETVSLRLPLDLRLVERGDPRWVAANGMRIEASVLTNLGLRLGTLVAVDSAFWLAGLGAADYQLCDSPVGPCAPAETALVPPPAASISPQMVSPSD